jgi:hypothetical protein
MTLVRRTAASKGKCKLAWNKTYEAKKDAIYKLWDIGSNSYPEAWFEPAPNQTPKPKPRLVHDSATGKLKVEHKAKPTREDVIAYIKANGGVDMPAHQLLGYMLLEGWI